MKRIRIDMQTVLTALVTSVALFCSNQTNPYVADRSEAALLSSRFSHNDSVEIFNTDTFRVELKLQQHIDSFTFRAPDNRYNISGDTTIRKTAFASSEWPWSFPFPVSFIDTGVTFVTLTAWRSDGAVVTDTIRLSRVSPLNQSTIRAEPGEIVTLSTPPVQDPNVIYVWKFGNDSTLNDQPFASKVISGVSFTTGQLYVKWSGLRSPSDPFSVVLADKKSPVITLTVTDSLSADSSLIFTGAIPYQLTVTVLDAGSALSYVTFNGVSPDSCFQLSPSNWRCNRQFPTLPTDGTPLVVVIAAADVEGNVARDTVQVFYDSTLIVTPEILVIEPLDSTPVSTRQVTVRGDASGLAVSDTLHLTLSVEGAIQPDERVLTAGSTSWNWTVTIPADTNALSFVLERRFGAVKDTVDRAGLTVLFDSNVVDNTPPDIVSITSNGSHVTDGFYASSSPLSLAVAAYDQSGIASVLIDGSTAQLQGGLYTGAAALAHVLQGNTIVFEATDVPGNSRQETRLVYLNNLPRITKLPQFAYIAAGTTYRDTVGAVDDDGDPLSITVLIEAPTGVVAVTAGDDGAFAWNPVAGDTGSVIDVRVQVSDGYPQSVEGRYQVQVTGGGQVTIARFITTAAEFPTEIVAGRDSVRLQLRIDQPLSGGNYLFSARIIERGLFLLQNSPDTGLRWLPGLTDTGNWTFEVIVSSGSGLTDTIKPLPVVRVAAPFVPPAVTFTTPQSETIEGAGMHYIGLKLSKPALSSVSIGYRVQWTGGGTTADTSDFSLPAIKRAAFGAGATDANIPVTIYNDTIVEATEKFTLVLENPLPAEDLIIGGLSSHLCYIIDNDTVARIDTVFIASPDSGGAEDGPWASYNVNVRIRARQRLSKPVRVTFRSGPGSATYGSDFTFAPADITMPTGSQDTAVILTIINDDECEPTTESLSLIMSARTPGTFVTDSVYVYGILPSDTQNCRKPVAVIYGGNFATTLETSIKAMLDSMGQKGTLISEQSLSSIKVEDYAAIFVSNTVRLSSVATVLRDAPIPVICASPANWVPLGLTRDSAYYASTTLQLLDTGGGPIDRGTVRITDNITNIPWGNPNSQESIVFATISTSGSGPILMKQSASGPIAPGSMPCIFRFEKGAGGNTNARRSVFPMCRPFDLSLVSYTAGWRLLLREEFLWAVSQ